MKLRTVALISLGVLVVGLIVGGMGTCSMRRQRDAALRQAAINESLHQIEAGRVQKAAEALENAKQLTAVLQDSLPSLYGELKDVKAESRGYVQMILDLQSDTTGVAATDTVYVVEGTSVSRVDFKLDYQGATVTGHTTTPPPLAVAQIDYKPIPLSVVVSQLRNKSWQANVETAPWVEISVLNTKVVPYRRSWLERHDFEIGVGLGVAGMLLIFFALGG